MTGMSDMQRNLTLSYKERGGKGDPLFDFAQSSELVALPGHPRRQHVNYFG